MMSAASFSAAASAAIFASSTALAVAVTCGVRPPRPPSTRPKPAPPRTTHRRPLHGPSAPPHARGRPPTIRRTPADCYWLQGHLAGGPDDLLERSRRRLLRALARRVLGRDGQDV